ncbi:hypothetical protein BC831DRAFT_459584 [Entophlyctis helioformis]|nr:hypothetical protein BC831DRAFT_459584 [Entophlyctis helioformis]
MRSNATGSSAVAGAAAGSGGASSQLHRGVASQQQQYLQDQEVYQSIAAAFPHDDQFVEVVQDFLAIFSDDELAAEPYLQPYVTEQLARWGRWMLRGRAPALCFEAACVGALKFLEKRGLVPNERTAKADAALARALAGIVIDAVEPLAAEQGGAVRQKAVGIVADEFLSRAAAPRIAGPAKRRIKKRRSQFRNSMHGRKDPLSPPATSPTPTPTPDADRLPRSPSSSSSRARTPPSASHPGQQQQQQYQQPLVPPPQSAVLSSASPSAALSQAKPGIPPFQQQSPALRRRDTENSGSPSMTASPGPGQSPGVGGGAGQGQGQGQGQSSAPGSPATRQTSRTRRVIVEGRPGGASPAGDPYAGYAGSPGQAKSGIQQQQQQQQQGYSDARYASNNISANVGNLPGHIPTSAQRQGSLPMSLRNRPAGAPAGPQYGMQQGDDRSQERWDGRRTYDDGHRGNYGTDASMSISAPMMPPGSTSSVMSILSTDAAKRSLQRNASLDAAAMPFPMDKRRPSEQARRRPSIETLGGDRERTVDRSFSSMRKPSLPGDLDSHRYGGGASSSGSNTGMYKRKGSLDMMGQPGSVGAPGSMGSVGGSGPGDGQRGAPPPDDKGRAGLSDLLESVLNDCEDYMGTLSKPSPQKK